MFEKPEAQSDSTPISTEIRERGEITIPKKIRKTFHFEAGQEVDFIPLGNKALLLAPRRLSLAEARNKIQKILKQTDRSLKEVLATLPDARNEVFQKYYKKSAH